MRSINHIDIGKLLREILKKEGRSLRRMSIDLGVDRSALFRSLKEGANPEWKTVEKVLNYLGYEIRVFKPKKGRQKRAIKGR